MRKPKLYEKKFDITATFKPTLEKRIKRGEKSWNFIRFIFAILLSITIFFISILPLNWVYKIIISIAIAMILFWLCFCSAWVQNRIIGLKIKSEETWRKI